MEGPRTQEDKIWDNQVSKEDHNSVGKEYKPINGKDNELREMAQDQKTLGSTTAEQKGQALVNIIQCA